MILFRKRSKHILENLNKMKKIKWMLLPVSAALFFGIYTLISVAGQTSAPAAAAQPGTRCTRLMWPKLSKQEKKDIKEGKLPGRCARLYGKKEGKIFPNQPPSIGLMTADAPGSFDTFWTVPADGKLTINTVASDTDGDVLLYTYSATGGRLTGDGPTTVWDLSGVAPGTYTLTTEVDDGCGCVAFKSATAEVKQPE